jgi:hypothetical protein
LIKERTPLMSAVVGYELCCRDLSRPIAPGREPSWRPKMGSREGSLPDGRDASRAANDKASLEHVEADCAAVGTGGSREPHTGHCESNQRGTKVPSADWLELKVA